MNRNSHLALLAMPQTDEGLEKENGLFSQALNTQNRMRQSQKYRAPFGEVNFETSDEVPAPKLKKKLSKIDPTVTIKVKNVRWFSLCMNNCNYYLNYLIYLVYNGLLNLIIGQFVWYFLLKWFGYLFIGTWTKIWFIENNL